MAHYLHVVLYLHKISIVHRGRKEEREGRERERERVRVRVSVQLPRSRNGHLAMSPYKLIAFALKSNTIMHLRATAYYLLFQRLTDNVVGGHS